LLQPLRPSERKNKGRGYGLLLLLFLGVGTVQNPSLNADSGRGLIEKLVDSFGRPANHGPIAANDDRPLHELRMLHQQLHNGLAGHVLVRLQTQVLEVLVLANQFCRLDGKQIEKPCQVVTAQWCGQVLDNVELDVFGAQDFERAA